MRIIVFFILFSISLFAKDITATYRVSFGIFGQIGTAKTTLHVENGRYKITVEAKSTGFAAFISGNRVEYYESRGLLVDGFLVPDIYKKVVQKKVSTGEDETVLKRYILTYSFNHKSKTVKTTKIKIRGEQKSQAVKKLKFYANNDILSLFFNFKKLFPSLELKKEHTLYAVGAEKNTGKIELFPLAKKEFSKLIDVKSKNLKFLKVVLKDRIFGSKKGELYLALDGDGFCQKAVLKDVIFFGDIRGERIEKNY